jgi:hypothetical protein
MVLGHIIKQKVVPSRTIMSSLRRGHANLLCIVPILSEARNERVVQERRGCEGAANQMPTGKSPGREIDDVKKYKYQGFKGG